MSTSQIEEMYHGFHIQGEPLSPSGDYDGWIFSVYDGNHNLQFVLQSKVSRSAAITGEFKTARNAGLHRCHGMIDLRQYEQGLEYEYFITTYSSKVTELADEQIRILLLKALYNIYRTQPTRAKYENIDVEGFCDVLGITKSVYEFNAVVLIDKGYASESPLQQLTITEGGIYISPTGIDKVEAAAQPTFSAYGRILNMIAQIEKHTPGQYVSDKTIAQESGLEIQDVRDWIEAFEAEGMVKTANSFDGHSASLTAKGRLLLKGDSASLQIDGGFEGMKASPTINVNIHTEGGAFIARDANIGGNFTGQDGS
ncbi:MAG: hypothetical protein R2932_48585 [Caldilineaceae bacterium]